MVTLIKSIIFLNGCPETVRRQIDLMGARKPKAFDWFNERQEI